MSNIVGHLSFKGKAYSPVFSCLNDSIFLFDINLDKYKQVDIIKETIDSNISFLCSQVVDEKAFSLGKNTTKYSNHFISYEGSKEKWRWRDIIGFFSVELPCIFLKKRFSEEFKEKKFNKNDVIQIDFNIVSHFDEDTNDFKPYFLYSMLIDFNENFKSLNVPSGEKNVFDFLTFIIFKNKAEKCFEKGIYKNYQNFESNSYQLKGNINFAKHIKYNSGLNNGKVYCSYRENTIINPLNKLILRCNYLFERRFPKLYNALLFNSSNSFFSNSINILKGNIFTIPNDKTLIKENATPITHPYFFEYEQLRKVCLNIINKEGNSFNNNDSYNEQFGILFYLPDLWELFLLKQFEKYRIPVSYQDSNKIYCFLNNKKSKIESRPDFVFYSDKNKKEVTAILDAKFRKPWENFLFESTPYSTAFKEDESDDKSGDFDKCIRDMVFRNIRKTGVIFPITFKHENDTCEFCNSILEKIKPVYFYTYPIKIPSILKSDEFNCWYKRFMDINEDTFKHIKESLNQK